MAFSLQVLKDRDSSRLFAGQLISQSCDKMMTVGLVWVLASRATSAAVPWFLGVSALPHLLLSGRSGAWTNTFGPLKTIVWADYLRGALFLVLALLWPRLAPGAELPALFAFSFVSNLAGALFNPAILSLPVFMPDRSLLQQLTALIDSCFSFGNILGPLLSAVLYPRLGLTGLFVFNGASYLLAAVLESGIRLAPAAATGADGAGAEKPATWTELLRADSLLAFMLGAFLAINLFLGPLLVFMPLYAASRFHGSIRTLAWLEVAMAAGMALGGAALSVLKLESRAGTKIVAAMLAVALSYLAFTAASAAWLGVSALLILGFALTVVNVFSVNLFQTRPAPRDVPTMMSLVNLISTASLPFSMAAVGFLLARLDARTLALACGGMLTLITLAVATNRELRAQ